MYIIINTPPHLFSVSYICVALFSDKDRTLLILQIRKHVVCVKVHHQCNV